MTGDKRLTNFRKISRGKRGKIADVGSSLIDNHKGWSQSTPGVEVVGDAAAIGTSICTLSIPAGKFFVCTHLMVSTNISAIILMGTGTLAAMTNIYIIDLQAAGAFVAISEDMPIFEYDNSAGAAAINLIMYAPQTAKNIASNNDVTHYFDGFIGGIQY